MRTAMAIISRDEAHKAQQKYYFTGRPCKNGHTSPRYVSTSGCIDCLSRHRLRINSFSHDLVAYSNVFWRSKRLTNEQVKAMDVYVQQCIDYYTAQLIPSICPTCTGRRCVPYHASMGIEWKACPDCSASGLAPGSEAPPLR